MKQTKLLAVLGLSLALASCDIVRSTSSSKEDDGTSTESSEISSSESESESETMTSSSESSSSSSSSSSSQTDNETEIRQYPGYHLVWSDEFEGNSLDMGKWGYQVGTGDWGWGNGELQYYTEGQNAKVGNKRQNPHHKSVVSELKKRQHDMAEDHKHAFHDQNKIDSAEGSILVESTSKSLSGWYVGCT